MFELNYSYQVLAEDFSPNTLELNSSELTGSALITYNKEIAKDSFFKEFSFLLMQSDFDYGMKNEADNFIEKCLNMSEEYTLLYLSAFAVEYFDKEKYINNFLRVIAHFDYSIMKPISLNVVACLSHKSDNVKENAIRVYENWNSKEALPILKSIDVGADWLEEYLNDVISELEDAE